MAYVTSIYHIVVRPKYSKPVISKEYETDLYKFIWGFVIAKECKLYRINGMPDHIHLLVGLHPSLALSDFVRMLKISTNNFLKANREHFPMFEGWGKSYCALSYSNREKDIVEDYIRNQKSHHRKVGFKEEIHALLAENDVNIDEQFFLKD